MATLHFTCTHTVESLLKEQQAIINWGSISVSACISNISACKYDTVCQKPSHCSLSHVAVAMAIEFSDESCPPMRCLRHSNRSDRLFMLTAAHLPTNLSAVGFRICTFPFFFYPPLHVQEILMRVHMFSSRLRVVLTLYLKLGLNTTLDAAVRVWHFPGRGIFAHLSQACALGQRLKIIWGCRSKALSQ